MDAANLIRVDSHALRETTARIFRGFDLPAADAEGVADALIEADLLGVSSHGVSNYITAIYAPGLRGGHKGYGLAALVDICCGVLSASGIGSLGGLGGSVGHFFGAVRVDLFRPPDEFRAAMDDYLRYLLESAPVDPNDPVIYAGVKEARAREDRLANGVPLHPKVVTTLRDLCRELGAEPTI